MGFYIQLIPEKYKGAIYEVSDGQSKLDPEFYVSEEDEWIHQDDCNILTEEEKEYIDNITN